MSLQKYVDQQTIHRRVVDNDLLVALLLAFLLGSQFHPVQRALPRQRLTLIPRPPPIVPPGIVPYPLRPPAADPAVATRGRSDPRSPGPTRTPAVPPTPLPYVLSTPVCENR